MPTDVPLTGAELSEPIPSGAPSLTTAVGFPEGELPDPVPPSLEEDPLAERGSIAGSIIAMSSRVEASGFS